MREDCRDAGAYCCLLVPSCAGRASSGGAHLGCFPGAVDAPGKGFCAWCLTQLPLCWLLILQFHTIFLSDWVTLISWGEWFAQGFFGWFGLYWFQGFPLFFLPMFLRGKALNFMDTLKDWCKGVLCSGLCSTWTFLTIHFHTPSLFHVFLKPRICGEGVCM